MRCLGNWEAHMPRNAARPVEAKTIYVAVPAAGNRLAPRRYKPAVNVGLNVHDIILTVLLPKKEMLCLYKSRDSPVRYTRRGIIVYILYINYQSVSPFVGIGSLHPFPSSKCVSPLDPKWGGATLAREWRGWGDPFRMTGKKAWHSVCTMCVHCTHMLEWLILLETLLNLQETT